MLMEFLFLMDFYKRNVFSGNLKLCPKFDIYKIRKKKLYKYLISIKIIIIYKNIDLNLKKYV